MLLCIEFPPFHPIIRPSVCQSVCTKLIVALYSVLSFIICFCCLESSTGTRSIVLSTTCTTRIMLPISKAKASVL